MTHCRLWASWGVSAYSRSPMNLIAIAAAVLLTQATPEWPGFRGPTGDGVAPAGANPPVEWSETKNVAWKIALPGRGRSSPVIFGDRIFVTFARETNVQRKK